jgi:hypothetical protein
VAPPQALEQRLRGDRGTRGRADPDAELLAALGRLADLLAQRRDGVRELAPFVRDLALKLRLSGRCGSPPW